MYDCSVKKGKQGCNYCLNQKPIDIDDFRIRISDKGTTLIKCDSILLEICYLDINYCPICGKQLRKELL